MKIRNDLPKKTVKMSDDLFDAIESVKWDFVKGEKRPAGHRADQWCHLQDAVERGTISPMEAFDAVKLGYLPENLKVRASNYDHLF